MVPLHIVPPTPHMLGLVIATSSTLTAIHTPPNLGGPACAWQIGHAGNARAIFNHLVPVDGVVEAGPELVHPLHNTLALAVEQWISHFTTKICFLNGLRNVGLIGNVRNFDV